MIRQEFISEYWRYYIHLENRFIQTLNYVELDERVAREIGRSASCIRYNVMMKNAPKVVRDTFPDTVRK